MNMICVPDLLWLQQCLSIQTDAKGPFATEVSCICGLQVGLRGRAFHTGKCLLSATQRITTQLVVPGMET